MLHDRILVNADYTGSNVAAVFTMGGPVLVDTPLREQDILEWKSLIFDRDARGAKYLVNTHSHFEHCIGNAKLGGTIIMHRSDRKRLSAYNEPNRVRMLAATAFPALKTEDIEFIATEPRVPSEITINDSLTLDLGDHTIDLLHTPGHTPGSLCVYVRETRTLLTGDTLTAGRHPVKTGADIPRWIESLRRLETLEIDRIVPGHGPVCGKDELTRCLDYFQQMFSLVENSIAQGLEEKEVVQAVHHRLIGFYRMDPEVEGRDRIDGLKRIFDMGTARLYQEMRHNPRSGSS
jgi:glyoxylase-like metal-dependent hydrolase (beta-lactamase superfamily II)